jgi:hypothetical protein
MTRRNDRSMNIPERDGPGFKSLDDLCTFIRIACEWDASIPFPKRPRREKPAKDRGSEP